MDNKESSKSDILGIKVFGEALKTMTQGIIDGAGAFLGRLCLPVAKEMGLFLKDHVANWRKQNTLKILSKAEELIEKQEGEGILQPNYKVLFHTIEKGSWEENDIVQGYWAGILADSCSAGGENDNNVIFLQILEKLTFSEIKIIEEACKKAKVFLAHNGLIAAIDKSYSIDELKKISDVEDIFELDRIMDHLHSMDLIRGGLNLHNNLAKFSPSPFLLQLYARANSPRSHLLEFYPIPTELDFSKIDDEMKQLLSIANRNRIEQQLIDRFMGKSIKLKGVYASRSPKIGSDVYVYINSCPGSPIHFDIKMPHSQAHAIDKLTEDDPCLCSGVVTKIKNYTICLDGSEILKIG